MKKVLLAAGVSLLLQSYAFGQGVGINDDNSSPAASAMLDVKSTNKGMLVPRMTTAQRIAIAAPATGLLVFDNTTTGFWYFDGTAWIQLVAGVDSDNQTLGLSGNTLSITGGNSVNLTGFANTDNQTLGLTGTTLNITGGNNVNLSSLVNDADAVIGNEYNTAFTLSGNNLTITDGGGGRTVSLAALANTDNQTMTLSGTTLNIARGNSVSLASLVNDADAVIGNEYNTAFTLSGNNLTITDGGGGRTVSLAALTKSGRNGLRDVGNFIHLGGNLVENTTVTAQTFGMNFNLNSTGDFHIQDAGINHFSVFDNGNTVFGGDVQWRDENTAGTILGQLIDDGNDGRFLIYENGGVSVDLDANTQFIFNEQGLDRNFRIESDANANMLWMDAGTNRLSVGTNLAGGTFNVQGNSFHSDDIYLRDGAVSAGDVLVRIYDSSDDGIIDVYENNVMNHRIHGNGVSVFNEQGNNNADIRIESDFDANNFFSDAGTNRVGIGTGVPAQKLHVVGTTRISTLAGAGNRMVVANANGDLLTQAITVGDITGVTAGNGLIGGGTTGNVTLNAVATNGLRTTANDMRLGGNLIENTTVTAQTFAMNFNLNSSGDFNIQDNGVNTFTVLDNGITRFGDDVEWRDGSTAGTLIANLFDDGNDGRFIVRENGGVSVDLDANTQFVFNEQGLDRNFRVEADVDANALFVDAGTNRVGIGTGAPLEDLHVRRADNDIARIYATGDAQGSGMFYAGQSGTFGGGFVYDGDGTPALVGGTDRISFFRRNNGADTDVMSFAYNNSTLRVSSLAGAGNRMVIANANGDLLTQAIPANGDITGVTAGNGLIGGATAGNATVNAVATNGLRTTANDMRLGGNLIENTVINQGAFNLDINMNATGDFNIQDNGRDVFAVIDNGSSRFGDDVQWRDGSTVGTVIADLFDDGNDGRFRIMENGVTSVDLDANSQFIFNEQGLDRNFRIESDDNANMMFVDADLNRVSIGTGATNGTFNVQGNSFHSDDIYLRDGAVNTGDVLVRIFDSADDGIIDVYENNVMNHRIHGNGVSVFNEQGNNNADIRMESDANANMFFLDAGTNRLSVGTNLAGGTFNVQGNSYHSDDIYLRDGAVNGGDVLVRIFDSADDGIIDVYENNGINHRIHGNGTSVFNEQGNNNADIRMESDLNANMFFLNAGTNRIGMGTGAPTEALHVVGTTRATTGAIVGTPTTRGVHTVAVGAASPSIQFGNTAFNNVESGRLTFEENMVNYTTDIANYCGFQQYHNGSANTLNFSSRCGNTVDIMTMQRGGNVGISTTAPTARLSVNGTANKTGGGTWAVFSDRRLKKDITDYNEGLSLINKVRTVNFSYNDRMSEIWGENTKTKDRIYQGVIAQELQEIAPDMVRTVYLKEEQDPNSHDYVEGEDATDNETFLEVDPNKFTYALINAVQEQQAIIEQLKKEQANTKKELAEIKALLLEMNKNK